MKDSFEKQDFFFFFFFFLCKPSSLQMQYEHDLTVPTHTNTHIHTHFNPVKSSLTFGFNSGFYDQLQPVEEQMRPCIFRTKSMHLIWATWRLYRQLRGRILPVSHTVPLPWRIVGWHRLRSEFTPLLHGILKLGHIQVTLSNSPLRGQNNINVVLFHLTRAAAKEVSCIRCYDKQNFSPHIAIFISYPITLRYVVIRNTWFWCLCAK